MNPLSNQRSAAGLVLTAIIGLITLVVGFQRDSVAEAVIVALLTSSMLGIVYCYYNHGDILKPFKDQQVSDVSSGALLVPVLFIFVGVVLAYLEIDIVQDLRKGDAASLVLLTSFCLPAATLVTMFLAHNFGGKLLKRQSAAI